MVSRQDLDGEPGIASKRKYPANDFLYVDGASLRGDHRRLMNFVFVEHSAALPTIEVEP
jgi:hypothetical protein